MGDKQKNNIKVNKSNQTGHASKTVKSTKTKKKKKSNKLGKVLLFLIIILIALIGGFIYKIQKNGGGMQGMLITLAGHDEETLKDLEPIQVLLMGVSTDIGGKLTDTIIIGNYDPKNQKASLLSIPRDTFVGKNPETGTGSDKINSVYKRGPEKTLEKVNELTGLDIKYYMVIDNQALIKLVDVIGGVEFNVPINMNYDDPTQDLHIHLSKGVQKLNGDKAEQLLRFRKNNDGTTYPEEYGGNDYGRMRTQREFMIETAKQTLQAKNILKVKDIIDLVYEYVDTNLSISTIKDYVPYAIDIDINTVKSAVIPGGSYGPTTTPAYPLWFFIADKKETAKLVEELYGGEEPVDENSGGTDSDKLNSSDADSGKTDSDKTDETSTNKAPGVEVDKKETSEVKVEIINGSGSDKTLTKVKKLLKEKGYNVTERTATTSTAKTTIINKTNVDAKFTDNIKDLLGVGNVKSNAVTSSNTDITILIGKDYK